MAQQDVSTTRAQTAPATAEPGWGGFDAFRREMDRLLDDFGMADWPGRGAMRLMATMPPMPALDMVETAEGYEITAELPGMDPSKIDLKVSGNDLILRGEKTEEQESHDRNRHVSERRYGSFQRRVRLPADADAAAITARTDKGILTVKVPKSAAASAAEKKIAITTG